MFISIGRNNQEKESLNWVVKNVSCLVIPKFSDCMAKLWHLSVHYHVYIIYLWLRAVLLLIICFPALSMKSSLPTDQLNMPVRDDRKHRDLHLEKKHVYNVYDQIAPKFTEISQKAWPNVRRFLKDLPPGSLVADIGRYIKWEIWKMYMFGRGVTLESEICVPV